MTIFACFFPCSQCQPIFDQFLMEGWKSVFCIGLAYLMELEEKLVQLDMTEMCMFF